MATYGLIAPAVSLSEAQAYLRVETGDEEAVVAGLIRTASALCEAFLNQAVIAREFEVDIPATGSWERLPVTPVRAVTSAASLSVEGSEVVLSSSSYGLEIDASGDAWVRVVPVNGTARVRVRGTAGIASTANEVPEPIRQGVLRLVAHLFLSRDGPGGEPPAAVSALWRPYRRARLA
jgi:uncharacterized phiE125 gp8 family phage protein